ncbi:hypothetical protein JHK82_018465 [Glycine max]|nr:hypothetical protein JHK85_018898 [Glycine max]KAG5142770.1 hypothetical protein JHK82_018465 [Glycine max]
MINDALRQWRTERSLGAFRMGLSVLKICITDELTEGKEPKLENSNGMADDLAAMVADKCMKVVGNQEKPLEYEAQFVRAKAPKGLIELVNGNL